jgi:hypothetical protein
MNQRRQSGDAVRFGNAFFGYAFLDFFVQQRFLFLRNTDWILPQSRINVLRCDYWSGLFHRNRRAFAHKWLVLSDDSGQYCRDRQ